MVVAAGQVCTWVEPLKSIVVPLAAVLVGATVAWVTTYLKNRGEMAKMRSESALKYKAECYKDLVGSLNKVAFRLQSKPPQAVAAPSPAPAATAEQQYLPPLPFPFEEDDVATAKRSLYLAHACGSERLIERAWDVYRNIAANGEHADQVHDMMCALLAEIRTDLGLGRAEQTGKPPTEEEERRLVRRCCGR
jgi:hypothetical protein